MKPIDQLMIAACVDRGGLRDGSKTAQFIAEWELVVRKLGRPITTEEFAKWWKVGRSTSFRRLALFRQVFDDYPDDATPNDLMKPLLADLAREVKV